MEDLRSNRTYLRRLVVPANETLLEQFFQGHEDRTEKVIGFLFASNVDLQLAFFHDQDNKISIGAGGADITPERFPVSIDVLTGVDILAGFVNLSGGVITADLTIVVNEIQLIGTS